MSEYSPASFVARYFGPLKTTTIDGLAVHTCVLLVALQHRTRLVAVQDDRAEILDWNVWRQVQQVSRNFSFLTLLNTSKNVKFRKIQTNRNLQCYPFANGTDREAPETVCATASTNYRGSVRPVIES
jgi:hypothetical protein